MNIPNEKYNHINEWIEFQTEKEIVQDFYNTIQNLDNTIFWDIGAYRGLYTLLATDYISHTYAFEPAPIPRRNLQQNCNKFNIMNYTSLTIPLYNRTQLHELTVDTTSGSRTFIKGTSTLPERNTSNTVTRFTQRADKLITHTNIHPPDIIKIDIEGAEKQTLQGFGDYLPKLSIIYAEIHLSQDKQDRVSLLLQKNGFTITTLGERRKTSNDYQKFIKAERK